MIFLRGSACSRCKNLFRFLICPRDPLRGSAWSRWQSRGRGLDSPLVCGSSRSSREAVVCGVYSWRLRPENRNPEAQTYSARSTSAAQLRLSILRADTSAERLAERNLHRAARTEQLEDRCRATCAQQLAESNLREQCSLRRHCHVSSCRTMRWSSHVAIFSLSIAACRHACRIDVKRCLRGWKSAWGKMLSGQSSSSFCLVAHEFLRS